MASGLVLTLAAYLSLVVADIKFVDLTHELGTKSIYWPQNPPFNFSLAFKSQIRPGIVAESNYFQTAEHSSTHMDAPRHFCRAGEQVHQITLDKLSGPGVVLDFKSEAEKNVVFQLTEDHVKQWENENGQIPSGAIVLLNFGWNQFWPDWNKVFNTDNIDDIGSFRYPGITPEASDWLAKNRKIHALGLDTPGPNAEVHVNLLCEHGVIILENVGNLDALPITGTRVFVGAIKLEYGSGTPVRLFATIGSGCGKIWTPGVFVILSSMMMSLFLELCLT